MCRKRNLKKSESRNFVQSLGSELGRATDVLKIWKIYILKVYHKIPKYNEEDEQKEDRPGSQICVSERLKEQGLCREGLRSWARKVHEKERFAVVGGK